MTKSELIRALADQNPNLFLSDIEAELEAASAAGMQTVWLVRDGEIPAGAQYEVARDFDEVNQWLIGTR